MTTAQIWVAIFLGFIVLMAITNRVRTRGRTDTCRGLEGDGDLAADITQIRADVAEVRQQLASMQRILEQVE